MSAAFAEVPVGFPRNPGLLFGNGFDQELPDTKEVVEAAAGDRVAAPVDHNRGLEKTRR